LLRKPQRVIGRYGPPGVLPSNASGRPPGGLPDSVPAQVRASDGLCSSAHPARPKQANISSNPKETHVFKFIRKMFGIVAGVVTRLPLFRPASIERELEQTLCLVRCCRKQRENAAARRPVSAA
jgi:hypothetical protein